MPILEDVSPFDLALGDVLRIPCKFIKGKSKSSPILIKSLANQLKETGKNILPIVVKPKAEDEYEAVYNILILEAAKQAGLDFVWCIPVNDAMESQVQAESGEAFQVSLMDASEKELVEALTYIKDTDTKLKRIDPGKVAKIIVSARTPSWRDLKPLTRLGCGIGAGAAQALFRYFLIEQGSQGAQGLIPPAPPVELINLLNSSEEELIEALTRIKNTDTRLRRIDPAMIAKVIVSKRTPLWKDLKPLTTLRCGIGASTAPILSKYFFADGD
jgi:hypothetical protein